LHAIGETTAFLSGLRHCALIKAIPEGWVNSFIYSLSIMKVMEVISNINNRLVAHIGLGGDIMGPRDGLIRWRLYG
jgi:hypothetical protein